MIVFIIIRVSNPGVTPEQIESALGLRATRTLRAGEKFVGAMGIVRSAEIDECRFETRIEKCESFTAALEDFIAERGEGISRLLGIIQQDLWIQVAIYKDHDDQRIDVSLTKKTVGFLYKSGVCLDIEIY
ncbi:MAG: hypothetical protein O9296_15085 [Novosphingobium sp.]|nr:hypothetical protein [Novosphingobium sp.]